MPAYYLNEETPVRPKDTVTSLLDHIRSLTLGGLLCLSASQAADACAFHGYTPDPTIVDILLGTEQAVIARARASSPNQYEIVEALLGPQDLTIPIQVDPEIRSRLKSSDTTVLLARDSAYGPWLELAVLDPTYREIIDFVIERQSAWGFGGDDERLQLFADHLGDTNPDIRALALMELDRADYSLLRDVKLPQMANIRQDLKSDQDGMTPIRVLLAGLSGDQNLSTFLDTEMANAIAAEIPYLGAYATALIELKGDSAVRDIVERYMVRKSLSVETREKLLEAFAIQKLNAPAKTRREINQGVGKVLRASPELASAAARQFGFRGDFSLAKDIERAKNSHPPTDVEDLFALNQYIGLAQEFEANR